MNVKKLLAAVAVAISAHQVHAMDLMAAWQAALQHDPQAIAGKAALQAGETLKEQALSLWRPTVMLSATAGLANSQTEVQGAHFSAPAFGASNGVGFATSVNAGSSTSWAVTMSHPLVNPGKRADSRRLEIAATAAGFEWQSAQQDLMLKTTQKYLDVVLLQRKVSLLKQQQAAVEFALTEAKDRFAAGDKPITDVYEATASARMLQAQVISATNELEVARKVLSNITGIATFDVLSLADDSNVFTQDLPPLPQWQNSAADKNPHLQVLKSALQSAQQAVAKFSASSSATLDLLAQTGREQLSGNGDFGSASNTAARQMIGLQLNVPLYTGGYRSAKHDEAIRLQEKSAAEVEGFRQSIDQQVYAAWLSIQTGKSQLAALTAAHQASMARLEATRIGRQIGDRTTLDLLQAQNETTNAELMSLQARASLLLNRLQLQALSGSLDEQALLSANALLR